MRHRKLYITLAAALLLFAAVSITFASLTFNASGISSDSGMVIDSQGTISIGTSTATGVMIGNANATTSLFGNVGIGTTVPSYKLDIAGDANITGTYRVNGSPISATSNWTQSGNNIYYTTGNVGIGTTSPTHFVQITPTSLNSGENVLYVSGTLNATAATQVGSNFIFTSNGSGGARQFGLNAQIGAGYTGNAATYALSGQNSVVGSVLAHNPFSISSSGDGYDGGNVGVFGTASGNGANINIASYGRATAASINYGGWFLANGITGTTPFNIGTVGYGVGLGTGGVVSVGGYFALANGAGTDESTNANTGGVNPVTTSTALIADNGSTGARIFAARNNGVDAFDILGTGNVGIGTTAPSTTLQLVASSTIRLGVPNTAYTGCIETYDSVNTSTLEYIYTVSSTLTATTTKPSFCQ